MSLNLLPPDYKDQLAKKNLWQHWQRALVFVMSVCLLLTAGTFAEERWLAARARQLGTDLDQAKISATAGQKENVSTVTTTLNTTIKNLGQVVTTPRSWSHDVSQVAAILPADVTLQNLSVATGGVISLEGIAPTRVAFIALDDALRKSPLLKNVQTKSAPSKRENLPFLYTAVLTQ